MLADRLVVIAGAMRSGTTSLHRWLGVHPAVTVSPVKEPHHFGYGEARHGSGPGDRTFTTDFVADRADYLQLWAGAPSDHLLVDGSAMTMHLPSAVRGLARDVDGARAVVVLRDPVERARSAHGYQRAKGFEPIADLGEAIAAEEDRRAAGWSPMWWYTAASRYAADVERLQEALGADAVHVIVAEHLWASPADELARLCGFLGIDDQAAALPHRNRGGEPRARWLMDAAYRLPVAIRSRLGPRVRHTAAALRDRLTSETATDDDLRHELGPTYTHDVEVLSRLLSRDDLFDWWPSVPRT